MDIKTFKQKETRRTVKGRSGNKNINIQIINYSEEDYGKWKSVIENAYISGDEELQLSDEHINELFKDFTNIEMTLDELNSILEDPNHTFSTIFKEIQIVLNEMIVRYLQEKQLEIINTRKTLEETNVLIESTKLENAISNLSKLSDKLGEVNG